MPFVSTESVNVAAQQELTPDVGRIVGAETHRRGVQPQQSYMYGWQPELPEAAVNQAVASANRKLRGRVIRYFMLNKSP